jgi:hypothetical protein
VALLVIFRKSLPASGGFRCAAFLSTAFFKEGKSLMVEGVELLASCGIGETNGVTGRWLM